MLQYLLQLISQIFDVSVIPRKIRYILIGILFCIILLTSLLLCIQFKSIKNNAYQKLSSLTIIKKEGIDSWIKDQIDDVNLLTNSALFRHLFTTYVNDPSSTNYRQLQGFLEFYSKNNDIKEILIVNKNFKIIFTTYNTINTLTEYELNYLKECASINKVLVTDLHYDIKFALFHVSVILPLFFNATSQPSFYIIAISDANDTIFPILSQWTGNDISAETYLVEKRSKQIYTFNNKKRHPESFNFTIDTLPKNNFIYDHLHASNNLSEGIDIYNNKVFSYAKSISELSWLIISKQNRSVLFIQWYIILFLALIIIILSMGGLLGFIIIYTKNNEKLYYQKISQIQNDQLKQFLQYKLILESIGDAIIVTDNNGNIEIFNYIAELLTGWQYKEVVGRYVGDVLNIFNKNLLLVDEDIFQSIIKGSFHGDYHTSILLSKNNTVIPIDFKGTVLKNHDEKILGIVIIIQDRTKESFFHLLSEIRIRFINYAMQHTKEEFIQHALKSFVEITHSQVSCFVSYKYYYNRTNDITHFASPDSFNAFCVDDTIDCTIDYIKLWNEFKEKKTPIIHNSQTQYFNCKTSGTSKQLRELFIPVFINNTLVAILGVGTTIKEFTPIDISRLKILAEIVYEIHLHKEKEESYKNLIELTNDLACIADLNTATFLMINPAFEKVLGYTQEELLSKPFTEFIHPDDIDKTIQVIHNELLKGNDVITFENRYRCKDGTYRWLDWNSHPVPSLGITYAIAHDITERKKIEETLRISEEKFRNIFEHSNDGICLHELVYDSNGNPCNYRIIDVNPQYEYILSLNREDVIGKLATEAYNTQEPPYFDVYKNVALTGKPTVFETYFEPMNKYFIISVFSPQKGQFATVFKDITEIKLASKRIEESEEKFSLFMKNLPLVVVIRDIHGKYIYLNDEWEKVMELKKEDWIGKTPYDVFPKEDAEKLLKGDKEAFEKGKTEPNEFSLHHSSGTRWWMANRFVLYDTNKKPAYVAIVYIDITERKKAEEERDRLKEQLLQAQKLESIGRLAGGVAHDYNNMLEVILGNAQLALMQIDNKKDMEIYLNEIVNAAKRSADVTRQLLTFARKQISEPQLTNINQVIENMLKMLRRLIGENIDLQWNPQDNLWNVLIDPTQINQIVANLCINARDAISVNGSITISTQNIILDETYCSDIPDCLPGEYVMLSVSDNGCGIDKDIIDKIFDPFFTTKEVGKGTGLGLSTVYGIIKQSNGFINVYSEKGIGTTFKLYFPRYSAAEDIANEAITAEKPLGKWETLLVVEDEESLLKMIHLMLERLQYKVITANSPSEAINIMKTKGEQVDVLLTDLLMPQMNGVELYQIIKQIKPDIQCIFMSGYTDIMLYEHIINKDSNFLQKPFSMLDLAKKLRNILDKK